MQNLAFSSKVVLVSFCFVFLKCKSVSIEMQGN